MRQYWLGTTKYKQAFRLAQNVFFKNIYISRHTIVCRAAQEAGTPHHEYIDRKKENVIFTPMYLGDTLVEPNVSQICPLARGVHIPNLKEIVQAISELRAAKVSVFFFIFFSLILLRETIMIMMNVYNKKGRQVCKSSD